ncbi:hypothetical protein [Fulvivirga lutimaris]|uniref:hypothetical protein n=1 Tax=Fulvivirga lutimaris TaxID=1819566 RepID=UPI0012BBCCDC|nr:hypothetical protein [Fulvivirga lutimaris]MTI41077.1 hypothetical protein [Fulvivirga lutimaris]
MKKIVSCISVMLALAACNTDEDPFFQVDQPTEEGEYLLFGTYAGECLGEECIEIFKLTGSTLSEDKNDNYPNTQSTYSGDFNLLSDDKFEIAKSLLSSTPASLLIITDTIIGQPDYADGGGIYFEYNVNNTHRYWLIDQVKSNVPNALHPWMDKVNSVVDQINE